MPTPTPQILLPYILDPGPGSLHLITSVLNAPANWLVVRSVLAALREGENGILIDRNDTSPSPVTCSVILFSLLRPLSLWVELGKKAGLDIMNLLAKRRLIYIDGTGIYGGSASLHAMEGCISLSSHALEDVKSAIHRATASSHQMSRKGTSEVANQDTKITLVCDGIDFLIVSQPGLVATNVCQMLTDLRQQVHSTVLTVSSDGALLHNELGPGRPLETQHKSLVASLAHQSRLVIQLRGLDTGTAKDVSGVIRISHGGGHDQDVEKRDLPEGEWLYKVSGDGSVKVWGRGG